jgi:hypothetical protein
MIAKHNRTRISAELNQLLSHLDTTAVLLHEYGCYVALSQDKSVLFWCAAATDGSSWRDEDDDGQMNWGEVTAPEDPAFIQMVNDIFGTSFEWHKFAGR